MQKIVIAVIDDDEPARSAVSALMRAKGFTVRTYVSAEDFLGRPAGAESCIIITDVQMPGLSGIDLKRRLTADSCMTPVIMITARTEPRLDEQAREAGAFCLLRKPFRADALLDCIGRALSTAPPSDASSNP